ncbi:MAG: rhamnulokinase [Verrucomicrobiae bacterium]|nr:rhamnulokinase [Verrucomicrobiae bacterium]NNJ42364.1 rhamnulokinase [Akkermansiaceae bacterium]
MKVYLAVDLGAGSGRVIAGKTHISDDSSKQESDFFELEELHRFENTSTELPGGYFWNIIGLYRDIIKGIRLGCDKYGDQIQSIGIDSWGCDYALISENGNLLDLPHQYRDPRSQGMGELADELIGQKKIYASTGIMSAFYNTSEHLLSQVQSKSTALREAEHILFIPDLLAYWLTGEIVNELTIASTSQLLNPQTKDWAWDIIEGLGLPRRIFGKIVKPSTVIGNVRPELDQQIGQSNLQVVATPSHDTASAVAGIPLGSSPDGSVRQDVWISSGTWSIMGAEIKDPILGGKAPEFGFANELGVENTVRFLKNISGLWVIQECQRQWESEGNQYNYAALAELAEEAEPFSAFIDPDDPLFASPGQMPQKIQDFCKQTGQKIPESKGTILRIASESIALKYRVVFDQLAEVLGCELGKVYMGGGGIQNIFLTQNSANAMNREVIASPIEATSCGNIISQMVATGELPDIAAGRSLIQRSQKTTIYQPEHALSWQAQLDRFKSILTTLKE